MTIRLTGTPGRPLALLPDRPPRGYRSLKFASAFCNFIPRVPAELIALGLASVETLQVRRQLDALVNYENDAPVVEGERDANLDQYVLIDAERVVRSPLLMVR